MTAWMRSSFCRIGYATFNVVSLNMRCINKSTVISMKTKAIVVPHFRMLLSNDEIFAYKRHRSTQSTSQSTWHGAKMNNWNSKFKIFPFSSILCWHMLAEKNPFEWLLFSCVCVTQCMQFENELSLWLWPVEKWIYVCQLSQILPPNMYPEISDEETKIEEYGKLWKICSYDMTLGSQSNVKKTIRAEEWFMQKRGTHNIISHARERLPFHFHLQLNGCSS